MARTQQTARKSTGGRHGRPPRIPTRVRSNRPSDSERDERTEEGSIKTDLGRVLSTAFTSQPDGSFAGSGTLTDAPNPCLNIDGLGPLGLPLSVSEAVRLTSVCEGAPYGKGVETLVNPAVRQTWQIDASQVHFDNPAWADYVQKIVVALVAKDLGVEEAATTARLYNLLVFSEGGHFERHQDTEKEPNMFGTLVIVLPSRYTGGEVVVTHRGQDKTFDLSASSAFVASFTCLYTDVYHNVKPVTSGYRLALVYNLVHSAPATAVPWAFSVTPEMEELRSILAQWSNGVRSGSQTGFLTFVVHLLEQNYSEFGLRFNVLKGSDENKVNYLRTLGAELGFTVSLTQLQIDTHGYADPSDNSDDSDDSDDELLDEENESAPGMIEETEPRKYTLGEFAVKWDGSRLSLRNMDVVKDVLSNIVPDFDLAKLKPDIWEDEGYLGNGAGILDHHYHRTLVLLWPKEYDPTMFIKCAGQFLAIRELERRVRRLRDTGDLKADRRDEVILLAKALSRRSGDEITAPLARAAIALEDTDMLLKASVGKSILHIDAAIWVSAIVALGFEPIRAALDAVFRHPLAEVGMREQEAQEVAKAFPQDQKIHLWASQISGIPCGDAAIPGS